MMTSLADPTVLTRRVRELVQGGRIRAARPMLAALRRIVAPSPDIEELEARLLLREGRLAEALDALDQAIAAAPECAGLRLCRADARMQDNDTAGAAQDAAEAVILRPSDAQAKAMLGIMLIELHRPAEAVACLAEAVASEPACPAYRQGLAEAHERAGDADAATATLAAGIAATPGNATLRIAAMMVAMRRRDFSHVAALAEAARQEGLADACVFGLLGHAQSSLGQHEAAVAAYSEALKLAPEDPYVRHLVHAAGLLPSAPRAPAEYLEVLFDGYAERFEAHLIGLGYRVPGLIRVALLTHLPADRPIGRVLDLGCGTGLIGVVLSDLSIERLVGVDLSAQMLAHADQKSVYAELIKSDLELVLADEMRRWAAILAADVFCYFGALDAVLDAAHARLEPGGLFVFTVEAIDEPGQEWRLRRQGRYAHAQDYLVRAATSAGFAIVDIRAETLRHEADAPVPGWLVVLRRVRHDG